MYVSHEAQVRPFQKTRCCTVLCNTEFNLEFPGLSHLLGSQNDNHQLKRKCIQNLCTSQSEPRPIKINITLRKCSSSKYGKVESLESLCYTVSVLTPRESLITTFVSKYIKLKL